MAVVLVTVEVLAEGFHVIATEDTGLTRRYSADSRTMVLRRVAQALGMNPKNISSRDMARIIGEDDGPKT